MFYPASHKNISLEFRVTPLSSREISRVIASVGYRSDPQHRLHLFHNYRHIESLIA